MVIQAWIDLINEGNNIRRNIISLKQKAIITKHAPDIASETNKRKGNFGEVGADLDLNKYGYESLHTRIKDIDSPGYQGIDGIYIKDGNYYIVEGKYTGSASLNPANLDTGLDRQMSDAWILADNRILNALGGNQVLVDDIIDNGFTRILAKTAPDGTVSYKYVSDTGYLTQGGGPLGNWTP